TFRWRGDQLAAREALAEVVVRVTAEAHRDPRWQERPEALPCRSFERDADGVIRQSSERISPGELAAEHRADRAVGVVDRQIDGHPLAALQGRPRECDELVVERSLKA